MKKTYLLVVIVLVVIVGLGYYFLSRHISQRNVLTQNSIKAPVESEYQEYLVKSLGITIKYPTRVSAQYWSSFGDSHETVPVKIIENGEVITISREYQVDFITGNKVKEDLRPRTPYYSLKYLKDLSYPYQIYATKVANKDELEQFVHRVYGKTCELSTPSGINNSKWDDVYGGFDLSSFNIEGPKTCPSVFPKGDIVIWSKPKGVAVGYQIGTTGQFAKPYDTHGNDSDYRITVSGLTP